MCVEEFGFSRRRARIEPVGLLRCVRVGVRRRRRRRSAGVLPAVTVNKINPRDPSRHPCVVCEREVIIILYQTNGTQKKKKKKINGLFFLSENRGRSVYEIIYTRARIIYVHNEHNSMMCTCIDIFPPTPMPLENCFTELLSVLFLP